MTASLRLKACVGCVLPAFLVSHLSFDVFVSAVASFEATAVLPLRLLKPLARCWSVTAAAFSYLRLKSSGRVGGSQGIPGPLCFVLSEADKMDSATSDEQTNAGLVNLADASQVSNFQKCKSLLLFSYSDGFAPPFCSSWM